MARVTPPNVVIIGSLNVDHIAQVDHLPVPGETVAATRLDKRLGGKGANQALAAARQGVQATLIGCLGDDSDGRDYRNYLRREGVNCSSLNTVRGGTGIAFISVDAKAENQIVVIPGANAALTAPAVRMQRARIAVAKALLLQLEIPLETAVEAILIANETHVPAILNASPIRADFPWGTVKIEVLIVNETEAESIFGDIARSQDLKTWAGLLSDRAIHHVIITRGGHSTRVISKTRLLAVPVHPVKPVDTVGAGDTFAGAFTAHFAEGTAIEESVRWANAAAALSTLKSGAQEGVPYRGDVQSALTQASAQ
ncbi:MAG: ribokinase [Verrucomicrobiota bacterium]